jgi:hypothetical protein
MLSLHACSKDPALAALEDDISEPYRRRVLREARESIGAIAESDMPERT